jgi:hypothetical protein
VHCEGPSELEGQLCAGERHAAPALKKICRLDHGSDAAVESAGVLGLRLNPPEPFEWFHPFMGVLVPPPIGIGSTLIGVKSTQWVPDDSRAMGLV